MRRSLALALALALALVAGCATPAEPAADANQTVEAAAAAPLVDDGSKSPTMNMTGMAHMPHMHDYWKGKERVTLFDDDLEPDAENLTFATLFQTLSGAPGVVGGMQFRFPDGTLVYEGAGSMEITASWSDPRVTGVAFIYISPDSPDFKSGGALPNGEIFSLPLTPPMTDVPHAKTSKWWFGFGPDKAPGALAGPWHLKIEIVRLNDIMAFPAHPDFWQGAHELKLLDADHHGEVPSYAMRVTQPATQGNFTEDWVRPTHIVPMETLAVRFDVTIGAATSTPGTVAGFGLFYHGADTFAPFRCSVQDVESYPAMLTWTVAANSDMSDSPYANESMWQFLVEPHVVLAPGTPEMGGMTDVSYDYHVVATALDAAPEDGMDETCHVDGQ